MKNPRIGTRKTPVPKMFWCNPFDLDFQKWNPPMRMFDKSARALEADMSHRGQIMAVILDSPPKQGHRPGVIDGHRRVNACRNLGVMVLCVCFPGCDPRELWRVLNTLQKKVGGNDLLGAYLREGGEAIPHDRIMKFRKAERIFGRATVWALFHMGMSSYSFDNACQLHQWLGKNGDVPPPLEDTVLWFHRFNATNEVRPLIKPPKIYAIRDEDIDRKPLIKAIHENKSPEGLYYATAKAYPKEQCAKEQQRWPTPSRQQ